MQFVDFWSGFENEEHWFLEQFRQKNSNGTLYSVYGANPKTENGAYNFPHPRVFFTVEPDHVNPHKERLKSADYSFSYHYGDGRSNENLKEYFPENHFKILNFVANLGPKQVQNEIKKKNNQNNVTPSGSGVAMVYSKRAEHRRRIFNVFNKEMNVSSAGGFLNNMKGGWKVPKGRKSLIDFMSNFRFYLAIENSKHVGYVTEKLYNALIADTIPIYWGDPDVSEVFNPEAFINISNFKSAEAVVDKVKNISTEDEKRMLNAPIADPNHKMFNHDRLKNKIRGI